MTCAAPRDLHEIVGLFEGGGDYRIETKVFGKLKDYKKDERMT